MTLADAQKPHWDRIDTVLLDLDGTLLDLAFDNYFWWECIPAAYAAARGLAVDEVRPTLLPLFHAREGTLEWYCIEHWSRELGLDVAALHRQERERVGWLPGAEDFLIRVRQMGKRLVLVTNAHPETLRVKDEQTRVTRYFHAVFSSHEFGMPKEDARFWLHLREREPFDRQRTLFVDDSPAVLRAGKQAGIRWIYWIASRESAEFTAVDSVASL